MHIQKEFKNITDFDLLPRKTNLLSDREEGKNWLFQKLAILYFNDLKRFKKVQQRAKKWLKKEKSETIFVLLAYINYIIEDFKKSKIYFLRAISLNPDNLDNWLDLAFTLRHLGEYCVSNIIFFNYDYVIYYYKYLKIKGSSYSVLKKLALEINSKLDYI